MQSGTGTGNPTRIRTRNRGILRSIILRDWAKEKISKSLDNALKMYEKQEEEEKNVFFLRNGS